MGRSLTLLKVSRYVLLDDGAQRLDAARLADVGVLGKTIRGAHDVGAQHEFRGTNTLADRWRLGLQPVKKAEANTLGVLQRCGNVGGGKIDDAGLPVVVAGPIEHRNIR